MFAGSFQLKKIRPFRRGDAEVAVRGSEGAWARQAASGTWRIPTSGTRS